MKTTPKSEEIGSTQCYAVPRLIGRGWLRMLALVPLVTACYAASWHEIPTEQLAAKAETDDVMDAGAEILWGQQQLKFSDHGVEELKYYRIKIYAARVATEVGRIRIAVASPSSLSDCGARIVRGGEVLREYKRKDFTTTQATERTNGGKRSDFTVDDSDRYLTVSGEAVTQLQITDLQPEDIVEYFQEVDEDLDAVKGYGGERIINLQAAYPIRSLEFSVGADNFDKNDQFSSAITWVNLPDAKLSKEGRGQMIVRATHIPVFRRENDMPPERDVRAYLILRLVSGNLTFAYKNWQEFANYLTAEAPSLTRPTPAMKQLATKLVAGAATPEEKSKRLHDYCQREIVNLNYERLPDGGRVSPDIRKGPLLNPKILELRYGYPEQITALFIAMAKAVGLDATLAFTSTTRDILRADRVPYGWMFMREPVAAVQFDGQWHYYSPGMRWAPFGQYFHLNQGTAVLVAEKNKPIWAVRPVVTSPEHDILSRQGRFKLDARGALTGNVVETLDGQYAMIWRVQHKAQAASQLENVVLKRVQAKFGSAEVKEIKVEDDHDNTHPVVLHYQLRVPDFATISDDRIIFAPNVLNARAKPRYTGTDPRLYPVRFAYGSVVRDQMELELPEGYELEAGNSPAPIDFSAQVGIKAVCKLQYAPSRRLLSSDSSLTIGLDGKTMFAAKAYPTLKILFEDINKAETHTLVLKPKTGQAAGVSSPETAATKTAAHAQNF